MSKKIENPIVLIHKRENSDSYAVAITNGSHGYSDAVLMASIDPGMHGNDIDIWSKTGYYMAAEIEKLREKLKLAEEKHLHLLGVVDDYDWQRQRLYVAAEKIIRWNRQEAKDRTGNAENAESYACVREMRDALAFCESSRSSSAGATENSRSNENVQVLQEQSGTSHGLDTVQSGVEVAAAPVNDGTTGKPLTITLPPLPVLGSTAEWYQGFAAGAVSMRDACMAVLISAGVEIIGEEK